MSTQTRTHEQALNDYTTLRNELAEQSRDRGGSNSAIKSVLYDELDTPLSVAESGAILKLAETAPNTESAFQHNLDGDPDDATEQERRSAVAMDVLFRDVRNVV